MDTNVVDLGRHKLGKLLRHWRLQRRLTQLEFAGNAEISTKHLSFLETGRAQPSREMVLRLAELLEVPLRERNSFLIAAGFAPIFPERPLDDPALSMARRAVDMVLKGHEPYPAVAVDRHWNLVAANNAVHLFSADPAFLQGTVNVYRLTLHPQGFASKIVNFLEWRSHALARLRQQAWVSSDPVLQQLYREVSEYPLPDGCASEDSSDSMHDAPTLSACDFVVPVKFRTVHGILSFFSTVTMFGTPVEITLSELAIESFYPADAATAEALRAMQSQTKSN